MSATPATVFEERSAASGHDVQTAIIVNPRSFRLSTTSRPDRIEKLAHRAGMPVHIVHGPKEIKDTLGPGYIEKLDRLIVIGGDGTVQAVVSRLAEESPKQIPKLLALGGGRTNFTARDLGTHAGMDRWLERALIEPESLHIALRSALVLEVPGQAGPIYGFFIAGALVDHVIRDCHEYRARHRDWFRTGHPSSAWRVIQLALLGMLGRSDFRPPRSVIEAGPLGKLDQPLRIFVATSLAHARGWLDPSADRGNGEVRVTAISHGARGFWLRLPGLLRGRFGKQLDATQGYLSGRTKKIVVRGLASVCVDGQEYQLDPSQTLTVRAGPQIPFLSS